MSSTPKPNGPTAENTLIISSHVVEDAKKSIGRFEFVQPLGKGGMGEVFLCRDPESNKRDPESFVAIKTIFPNLLQDHDILQRFEAEARMLAPIQHTNVVRLIEWGLIESHGQSGTHYMAMEYIDGISLHSLSRRRRISFPDVLRIALQIARGLHAVHAAHVVHRDIKPANVMVTKDGIVKIIDFGIAKPAVMRDETEEIERGFKTKTGVVIGTVNYIAPEVLRGGAATMTSDIYGLGLIIWEMLNGATPFKSANFTETIRRVNDESLTWADAIIDVAPLGFTRLVSKLTAKDPSKRIQAAAEVVEELEKMIEEADWQGIFNRPTRFDLDLLWSEKTVEEIKKLSIKEGELLFVLQEIEDRLILEGDDRLARTEPIEVDSAMILSCINNYKSSRYKASIVRQGRLKAQLTANAGLGVAGSPATSSGQSQSSPSTLTKSNTVYHRVAIGITATIVTFICLGLIFTSMRKKIRAIADDGTPIQMAPPLTAAENFSVALRSNVTLVYKVARLSPSGAKLETQETRKVTSKTAETILWNVDAQADIQTPRAFFPLETYFNPVHWSRGHIVTAKFDISDFYPLDVGRKSRIQFEDKVSDTIEDVRCTPINHGSVEILGRASDVWKIECMRIVTLEGRLTHRIYENYDYAPVLGFITSATIKTDELTGNGDIAISSTRTMSLDYDLSRFN